MKESLTATGLCLALFFGALPQTSLAQSCTTKEPFPKWLAGVHKEAQAAGVSASSLRLLDGLKPNQKVIDMDRRQGVFAQTFLTFAGRMANNFRLTQGKKYMQEYDKLFRKMEEEHGVPRAVVTAFWALETDFGANTGDFDTLTALATLAHDCRRPELFRPQLIAALEIVDKGYLTPERMKGAWAGELGQTQLLPTDYLRYGRDADGDGHVDLIKSKADVIATTSGYLAHLGWKAGQPWLQEVKVPAELPWDQADLQIQHPVSTWEKYGVKPVQGAFKDKGLKASLLLPMGKNGPAFLAYDNFHIYTDWNKSLVYATTAAYLATRLAGAPVISPGRGEVDALSLEETKTLQRALQAKGHDVGKIDGVIGAATRAAVRTEQLRLGLPADSYPTKALLRAMQR